MSRRSLPGLVVLLLLALPGVAPLYFGRPDPLYLSVAYLVVAPLLLWWRAQCGPDAVRVTVLGYVSASLMALAFGLFSGPAVLTAIGLTLAILAVAAARIEQQTDFLYLAVTLAYLGLAQMVEYLQWGTIAYAGLLSAFGAAIYALGYYIDHRDPKTGEALRHAGMAAPFLGSLLAQTAGGGQIPAVALAAGAGLLYTESYLQQSRNLNEIAGSLLLVTYDWLLATSNIGEIQIYTLPWAAWFAYLATRRRDESQVRSRQYLTGLALAALTIPIAIQSVGNTVYGFELIFIGLVMMMIGSSQFNTLVVWWGAAAILIEVLYTIPHYLLPDTQLPFLLAALGFAGFAVAVMIKFTLEEDSADAK